MKKLRVIAMADRREELLKGLLHLGCLEISEPDEKLSDPAWSALLQRENSGLSVTKSEIGDVNTALAAIKRYAQLKDGIFIKRHPISEKEFLGSGTVEQARQISQQVGQQLQTLTRLQGEETRLLSRQAGLEPWRGLDMPLEVQGTQHTVFRLMVCPGSTDMTAVQTALADTAAQMLEISADKQQRYCLLICHRAEEEQALECLRPFGFSATAFQGLTGTPAENLNRLAGEIAENRKQQETATAAIVAQAGARDALRVYADRLSAEAAKDQNTERLLTDGTILFFEGWAPAEKLSAVGALLDKLGCAWEASDPTEDEISKVPVQLKNNWLTKPLNMVTEMYSLPAYNNVDPNPLMAPFFILFYGIMMADMGYGLVMMIAALVALGKMKPKRGSKYFCELLFACGVSTFLLGIVTGGFFGNAVPTIVNMFGHDVKLGILTSPLLDPLTDTTQILIGAMVLGFIQLSTGMVVNMVMECRQGKVGDAIFNEGTWFVIFAGLALFVLKIGNIGGVPVVLCIGVLMLIYGSGREAKGFGKVTAVFGAVYNGLTGWFGDILSYSRLMALMLAGSVIAQVFNTLAAMPSSGGVTVVSMIVFIIIFLLGHLLNFGLNLLGCFVHDLRLQCLEFFGKFYVDGGKPFRPLEINTRYVDVENHNF